MFEEPESLLWGFEKTYVKVFDPKKFQIIIFFKLFCQQKIYPDPDVAKYLNTNP